MVRSLTRDYYQHAKLTLSRFRSDMDLLTESEEIALVLLLIEPIASGSLLE